MSFDLSQRRFFGPWVLEAGASFTRLPLDRGQIISLRSYEAGPRSVPEEDHTLLCGHVRDPKKVSLVPFSGVESVLYLFPPVGCSVDRELLGKKRPWRWSSMLPLSLGGTTLL